MCGFAFFPTKIILEKLAGFVCPNLLFSIKMLKQFMRTVKTLLGC